MTPTPALASHNDKPVDGPVSAHTPGPWSVSPDDFSTVIASADGETEIAEVYQWDNDFEDEHEANARLIAAAPELLEALRQAWIVLPAGDVAMQVSRAIAKATGAES